MRKQYEIAAHVETLRINGWCRAASVAVALRAAGFDVPVFPIVREYYSYKTKRMRACFIKVPWAEVWAVNLAKDFRKLNVDRKLKKFALKEACELGKPGPLAESLLVAGKMMK